MTFRRPALLLTVAALLAAGCGPKAFSDQFVFGVAIAGFQVDPGCPTVPAEQCEDRASDWYQWVTSPNALREDFGDDISFEPLSDGPGLWELYEHDFDLAHRDLGVGAVRLSLEWSRLFPTATDGLDQEGLKAAANPEALATYHAMFAALRARGLKPLVTVNHYTLPLWLHDGVACHQDVTTCQNRGWLGHDRIVTEMAKYAGFVGREFGAEVDWWATLNEPFAVVLPGYLLPSKDRVNPPGLTLKFDEAKAAMVAMIDAHARMYDALKANDLVDADRDGQSAVVGLVYSATPTAPKDPQNPLDVKAAENVYYLYNTAFLDAVIKGRVDANLDGTPDDATPRGDLVNRIDYLGVNYYTRITVSGLAGPIFPSLSPLSTFDPTSLGLWAPDVKGLYDVTLALQARYGLPMYITETGANVATAGASKGTEWLVGTVTWAKRAIRDGADLRGYFAWSLIDNYEWNQGMAAKFGLYEVANDATKTRTAREAAGAMRDIARARDVPAKWLKAYPVADP